jgi:transcription initiation factor IIF auxiliary subunit
MNFAYRLVTDCQGRIEYKQRAGDKKHIHLEVSIDEPPPVIDSIRMVEYRLHESFVEPIRHNDDASSKFAEQFYTWGKFPVAVTVLFVDGLCETFQFNLDYSLPPDFGLNYIQIR